MENCRNLGGHDISFQKEVENLPRKVRRGTLKLCTRNGGIKRGAWHFLFYSMIENGIFFVQNYTKILHLHLLA